jgi:hypothetical protein
MAFPQPRVDGDSQAQSFGDDLRGLQGPAKVAAEQDVDVPVGQSLGKKS